MLFSVEIVLKVNEFELVDKLFVKVKFYFDIL